MKVFVSVGTDHHPFDRLVGWADRWSADHPDDDVLVQHGPAAPPSDATGRDRLPYPEMLAELSAADVVVVSCGPGAVMDSRRAGRLPVVVARHPERDEIVDDHQRAFARHLHERGLARSVDDEDEFRAVLDHARGDPDAYSVPTDGPVPEGIAAIGRLVDDLVWGR